MTVYLHIHVQQECSAEPFMCRHLVTNNLHISPWFSPTIFYRDANSVLLLPVAHLRTALLIGSMCRILCSKLLMMRASVKVYLHMYNGHVQQNPLCVECCIGKEVSISLRFSPTIFDPDANSVLLRAHLCTAAVDSMRRERCV